MTPEAKLAQRLGGYAAQQAQDRKEWRGRLDALQPIVERTEGRVDALEPRVARVENESSKSNTFLWCIGINLAIFEGILIAAWLCNPS